MPRDIDWGIILRLLLAGVLVAMLNLAPRPHAIRQALDQARQEVSNADFPAAFTHVESAAEQIPWRFDLSILAARYAMQSGLPLQAIRILEQPRVTSRLAPSELLMLGDAYQQSGDTLMAAAIWQRVTELAPSPEIYQRLADHYQMRQDYPATLDTLLRWLQLKPMDADLNYRIGLLYTTMEPDSSEAYLAQAADLDPSLAPAAQELQRKIRTARLYEEPAYTFTAAGRALAALNEWALAEAAFLQATQLRPDYAEGWAFLGEARQHVPRSSLNKYAGLSELQHALRLNPDSVSANLLSSLYWTRQGEYSRAASYLKKTITLEPENPLLHAELADALAQQGDLPAAMTSYQQAISLAPDDPFFYRVLVEFSLTHQIQVREIALPAARTAVILAPEDPEALVMIGRTLLALEDDLSAERFLFRALKIDPTLASAHLNMGIVFIQRGDMEKGRHQLDLAEAYGNGTWTATQAHRFITYYYP